MCGIMGYTGFRPVKDVLLEGLKRLEYRGYDSAGLAAVDETGRLVLIKAAGKIKHLEAIARRRSFNGARLGIAHTRWATHGAPTRSNAHPHVDCRQRFIVVHNGIIENYEELKRDLIKKGHRFRSETDTEVLAHLCESADQGDVFQTLLKIVPYLKGAFAVALIDRRDPDQMAVARVGSPLIIGVGDRETFVASDVPAVLPWTRRVIYLKDGEAAAVSAGSVTVTRFDGRRVRRAVEQVDLDVAQVQKGGFDHFMLKEIHEQPAVLQRLLNTHAAGRSVVFDLPPRFLKPERITVVACGTAYHAGLVGKYLIEYLAGIPVNVEPASEFRYRRPALEKGGVVLAISQSGETADTLAAVKNAKQRGQDIVAIVNAPGSTLTREADAVVLTQAGPEIGVASTKAYTAQVMILTLLALALGARNRSADRRREVKEGVSSLKSVVPAVTDILKSQKTIAALARRHTHFGSFLYLGRFVDYPTALEGALKLKEISYIPAEGYAAGEMKHGPIALIDEYRAVVCVAPRSPVHEKMISNMQEILSRKGKIVAVATKGDRTIRRHAHDVIEVPPVHPLLSPLVSIVPLQLFAYHVAVARGCDVDQPRNLAKSVTVE